MTWGRMDDRFHRSKKVRGLRKTKAGREALGAWAFWWSWCLSDPELTGEVPMVELPPEDRKSAKLLVEVGLWDETEEGFRFHDFHEYNPTKKQRSTKLEADRSRMAESRATSRDSRESVARDVASESSATSPPRASAGSGSGTLATLSLRPGAPTHTHAYTHTHEGETPESLAALERLREATR